MFLQNLLCVLLLSKQPGYVCLTPQVLKERLGVYCVLALTATATYQTALSVATNLGISQESIIRGPTLPDNLYVSVSCDQDRDQVSSMCFVLYIFIMKYQNSLRHKCIKY